MKARSTIFIGVGALLVLVVAVGLAFASDASPSEEPAGSPFFDATLQQAVDELDGKAQSTGMRQPPQSETQHYTTDPQIWPECQFGYTRDLVQWPFCHYTSDPAVWGACGDIPPWPTKDYTWDSQLWPECDPTGSGITTDPSVVWCDPLWTFDPQDGMQCVPGYTTAPDVWLWCNPRYTKDPNLWAECPAGVPYTYEPMWTECMVNEPTTDPYLWGACHYTSDSILWPEGCEPPYPTQDYTSNPYIWPECPGPGYTQDPSRWPWCEPRYTELPGYPDCEQYGPYTTNPERWPWCQDPQSYTTNPGWWPACHVTSDPILFDPCFQPWPTMHYTSNPSLWPACDVFTQDPSLWLCNPDLPPHTQDPDLWPWCNPAWTWEAGVWPACEPGYTNDPGTWGECDEGVYTYNPAIPECEFYTGEPRIWPECHYTSDPIMWGEACLGWQEPTKDYTTDPNLWGECDVPPGYTSDPDTWPECHYTSDPQQWPECKGPEAGDLGDAPDSTNHVGAGMTAYPLVAANYPTVFDPATGAPPGPKHLSPRADAWLGPWVTLELDADLLPDEDLQTNIDPPTDKADRDRNDDGLLPPVRLPHCQLTVISYTVTVTPGAATAPRFVNVWFDWNRDGDWEDVHTCPQGLTADEWAVQDHVITVGPGTYTLQTPPILAFNPTPLAPIWMRITLAEAPAPTNPFYAHADGNGPALGYMVGETEDYYLPGEEPELGDLGDAPDSTNHAGAPMTARPGVGASYPTVFDAATGLPPGPKHWQPHLDAWLGPTVTLEFDADLLPDQDVVTNIDPRGNVPDRDRADDGVSFPIPIALCQRTWFTYTVTVPPGAAGVDRYVNVWFDWLQDGDWDDIPQCPQDGPAPEWAVQNQLIPGGFPPGTYVFATPLFLAWYPLEPDPDRMWMRISIAEQPAPTPAGAAMADGHGPLAGYEYGETEDYFIEPSCPPPVADFVWDPPTICPTTTVGFVDTSTSFFPISSWSWDFGDTLGSSSLQNPTYAYSVAGPGTYNVTLTVSNICGRDQVTKPLTVIDCPSQKDYDIYLKDNGTDDGSVPSASPWWVSPDIWVRNDGDCTNPTHENPDPASASTKICVRVRNRMATAVDNIVVNNYWANAALALSWPASWSYLGTFNIPNLAGGATVVKELPWSVPYIAGHFCLLSRADALKDPLASGPDTMAPVDSPPNNNNIAQKNTSVVQYPEVVGCGFYTTTVATDTVFFDAVNTFNKTVAVTITFDSADFPLATGTLIVEPGSLWGRWSGLTNFNQVGFTLRPTGFPARMTGVLMNPSETARMTMTVSAEIDEKFTIEVTEYMTGTKVGGIEYVRDLPSCVYLPLILRNAP